MLGTYKLLGTYELAARAGTIDAGKGFASNFTLAGPSAPCGHSSSNIVVAAAGCWPVGQAAGCWLLAAGCWSTQLARGTPKHPECPLRLFEGSGCEQSWLVGRARVAGRAGWSSWHDRLVELAGRAGMIRWSASAQRASGATWLSGTCKLVAGQASLGNFVVDI